MASKTDDLIFVAGRGTNFDDDSHRHFVKLFVFICGDMNGVTPWLRAIFVSVYHKESLNNKNAYAKHSGSKFPKIFHLNFPAKKIEVIRV